MSCRAAAVFGVGVGVVLAQLLSIAAIVLADVLQRRNLR